MQPTYSCDYNYHVVNGRVEIFGKTLAHVKTP